MTIFNKQQKGFTLVELMVSIVIGLFLLAGVLTVFTNSRQSQRVVDEDVRMMDDARFALETIAYDLRHAGGYGHHNHEGKVNVHNIYDQGLNGVGGKESEFTTVTDQCGGDESNWVVDVNKPVFAVNDGSDYLTSCMPYWAQGDTIEMRYAVPLPASTAAANLIGNALYLQSIPERAELFKGNTLPLQTPFQANMANSRFFLWQARAYYIANHTDSVGDGLPSLRLASLEPGPIVTNTVLLKGVEDLQVQFGLDKPVAGQTAGNESASSYANPAVGMLWNQAIAARIWLIVRSEKEYPEIVINKPYEVAGAIRTFNDKYKRIVVSTSVRLRNINTGE